MILTASFVLALAVPSSQTPQTVRIAGRDVAIEFPSTPQVTLSQEVLSWDGWKLGQIRPRDAFVHGANWADIPQRFEAAKANAGVPWRTKVIVFERMDALEMTSDGLLRRRVPTLELAHKEEATKALARLGPIVSSQTEGAVKLDLDVEFEPETVRDRAEPGKRPFGAEWLTEYLTPRINGGSYQAEDKIYRGPYSSVLLVVPTVSPVPVPMFRVNGMPVATVPFFQTLGWGAPGALDRALYDAWFETAQARAMEVGLSGRMPSVTHTESGLRNPALLLDGASWSLLADPNPAPTEVLLSNLAKAPPSEAPEENRGAALVRTAPIGVATTVELSSDLDRGQVLKFSEVSFQRQGGLAVDLDPVQVSPGAVLSVWAKSKTSEPLSITLLGEGGASKVFSFGADVPTPVEQDVPSAPALAFQPNGQWQQVRIPLEGLSSIQSIVLGPSPRALSRDKVTLDIVEFYFDDFELQPSGSAALNPGASLPAQARAARAVELGKTGNTSPELLALVNDPADVVRMNAAAAYQKIKDDAAVEPLIANAFDLNPRVSEQALRALAFQGTDAAKATILRALRSSLSEHTRSVAAELVAGFPDENLAAAIVILLAHRSWQPQLAAVEGLAKIGTPQAQQMMEAFIRLVNPQVKLAVTQKLDPSNEDRMRRIALWSSVNEPSDAVRAWSNLKLIQSPLQELKNEGYKGVRDESWWARIMLLNLLRDNPADTHRQALMLAITDSNPLVRAAAVDALAALEGPPTPETVASFAAEQHPQVQLALIEWARRKRFALPEGLVQRMNSSPDPRVREAIGRNSG